MKASTARKLAAEARLRSTIKHRNDVWWHKQVCPHCRAGKPHGNTSLAEMLASLHINNGTVN